MKNKEDKQTLLSVIVPVYNGAGTLERAVMSIFRQGLNSDTIEVLLVNDGSKDNSLDICYKLAKLYSEIRVIDKPNGGVASARNKGLGEAKGEWIVFLDDDDWLLNDGYSIALLPYLGRSDIDVIRYYSSYDNSSILPIDKAIESEGKAWDLIKQDKAFLPSFVWLQCYRRDYVQRNNIRFQSVAMFDDYLFASSVFLTNPYLLTVKANILRYTVRKGSGTLNRSVEYSRSVALGAVLTFKQLTEFGKKTGASNDKQLWDKCLAQMNNNKRIGVTRMLSSYYCKSEYKQMSKLCHDVCFYPVRLSGRTLLGGVTEASLNAIMSNWMAYRFYSFLFNKVIEPYIMPLIRKHLK